MSLLEDINQSQFITADCIRLAAVWVGHIDHEFSDHERDVILARLPDQAGGMPLSRIVHYVAAGMNGHAPTENDLANVFATIKANLAPEAKEAFMRLTVEMVTADRRISVGEKHALGFIADIIGEGNALLRIFEEEAGVPFGVPTDLSDPDVWEAIEANQRKQSTSGREGYQEHQQQRDQAHPPSGERIEALAVLGLVGNPSMEEIKLAYRRLARIHHPDRYQNVDAVAATHATKTFQRIQRAYRVLEATA